jgi:hypothetical protein
VTINRPASNAAVTIGVLPLLFDANATAPPTVNVPNGLTTATFTVQVTEPSKPATLYLIASLNGGTMVAPVEVSPGTPRITGQVVGKGRSSSGAFYVDVRFTNGGNGAAQQVSLNQILPRVLSGTGTVTLAVGPGLTSALPISVGPMPLGDARIIRVYFNVPTTVKGFSITENGSLRGLAGTNFNFSVSQSVIP